MAAVKCPICGTLVVWSAASPFRPFCSERCKNVDLGAWASERYAVSDEIPAEGLSPDDSEH
ncbi:MAG: DNA gyrase inhibitor YacG [Burkholderiaceae bacterium]